MNQTNWNDGACELCGKMLVPDIYGGAFHCVKCKLRDERDLKLIVKALRIIRKGNTCPSLDSLRNTQRWVSRKDGAPSRHQNEQGDPPGKAAYERQPVGHTPTQGER